MDSLIQRALDYGGATHSVDDVKARIGDGRAQLWRAQNSAVVTEVIAYPRLRAVRIWLAAGDLSELLPLQQKIEDYARRIGARRVEIAGGRPGWERALTGYKRLCPCAVKEV